LTNLLDCLNVFSHSLARESPLMFSYRNGTLELRYPHHVIGC
jgi:hypothetical protein